MKFLRPLPLALAVAFWVGCGSSNGARTVDDGGTGAVVDAGTGADDDVAEGLASGDAATAGASAADGRSEVMAEAGNEAAPRGGGFDGGPLDVGRVAADLARSECGRYAACEPFELLATYGSQSACEARLQAVYASILTAQGVLTTLDQAESCASAKAALSCSDFLSHVIPATCQIPGSLATGAACTHGWQCSGAQGHCKLALQASCGTCGALAPTGGACAYDADCASGLLCGSSATCVMPAAVGGPCLGSNDCAGVLTCLGSRCAVPLTEGSSCDDSMYYGAANGCDVLAGLYCTGTCVKSQIALAGETCSYPTQSLGNVGCATAQVCDLGDAGGRVGTCPAAVADGQSCTVFAGSSNCFPPAVCSGGICKLRDGTGCR